MQEMQKSSRHNIFRQSTFDDRGTPGLLQGNTRGISAKTSIDYELDSKAETISHIDNDGEQKSGRKSVKFA